MPPWLSYRCTRFRAAALDFVPLHSISCRLGCLLSGEGGNRLGLVVVWLRFDPRARFGQIHDLAFEC